MATNFPLRARRGDPEGYMVVQQMLEFLRDAFDTFVAKFNQGSATVAAGTTSVVVSMGRSLTTYQVNLTPLANPGGSWWVSAKTATQFQINLAVAAPAGGVGFDWIAKGV